MILKTRLFYRQWTRNKTSRKLHLPQLQDCLSPTVWRQCRKYRDSVTSHQVIRRHQQNIHSLKRFFSRPMKIWAGPQKDGLIFQASIFRGEKCKLVSGISNKKYKKPSESLNDSEKSWRVPGTRTKRITEKKHCTCGHHLQRRSKFFQYFQAKMKHVDVSKNRGTPTWMVYKGKPYKDWWFGGTPIFGNTHITAFAYAHLATPP